MKNSPAGNFACVQTLRTPDERFARLPEFGYTPMYYEIDDDEGGQLRVAWVQDGPDDADPVLLLHGEPSWSFLWSCRRGVGGQPHGVEHVV